MAPLKLVALRLRIAIRISLPCLKRHGSIEALVTLLSGSEDPDLPCLKRHGSIEACRLRGIRY